MASTAFMRYLALQTEVEQQDSIDAIRRCFDSLLAEFPLSYGHWKRYADHEVRHGSVERATEVYERGVKAAAYCVELWSFYAAHAVTHWSAQPDKVRAVFERAVRQVGSDYLADKLWDRYIAFETPRADASATPDHSAVGALFSRVLRLPLKALDSYWARLGQLASTCSSSELLDGAAEAALLAELEARGVAPQPQPGAEGLDEGARKLRVMPMLEARYNLLGLTWVPNPHPSPNPNPNPNLMPMLEARCTPHPHPNPGPGPNLHLALGTSLTLTLTLALTQAYT